MKKPTIMGVIVIAALVISILPTYSMQTPQAVTTGFQERTFEKLNGTYVDAKGVVAGNTQAMVAWGDSETPGSLMLGIQHLLPLGIAEVRGPNGTAAIPLISMGYLFVVYDFVGEVERVSEGRPELIKQVNLHEVDWNVSTAKSNITETSVEYQLTAETTSPYVGNVSAPAPTIRFRFHLFANTTELNNVTQRVFVIERDENGEITVAREERNVTVPVTRTIVRFKVDYEIENWTPSSNTSRVMIGFRLAMAEAHPLLVNRLLKKIRNSNTTITIPEEMRKNQDLKKPIRFHDISGLPKRFSWEPTALVDGVETQVRVRFWNMEMGRVVFGTESGRRAVARGVSANGLLVYQSGQEIIHDPDIEVYSQDIPASSAASILEEGRKALPAFEYALALTSVLVVAVATRMRKK